MEGVKLLSVILQKGDYEKYVSCLEYLTLCADCYYPGYGDAK